MTWGSTGGAFKNLASATGLTSGASTSNQHAAGDRALGIRQTADFGDPGAAITLEIANTAGFGTFAFAVDFEMLSVQGRSTTWTVQYATGSSPTTFTTLGTYTDPAAFGATNRTFDFGDTLNDVNDRVWIRVATLSTATGTGSRDTFGIDNFHLTWLSLISDLHWDPNLSSPGVGGSGTWSGASLNWNSEADGSGGLSAFASGSRAVFGGTSEFNPAIVEIAAAGVTTDKGLEVRTAGYSFAGPGAITLGATPTIKTDADVAMNTTLSGTSGMRKTGAGILLLGAVNDFQGPIEVHGGTISVSADDRLGAGDNDLVFDNGRLLATETLSLGAGRTISGSGSIAAAGGKTLTVSGDVIAERFNIDGPGSVVLAGATRTMATLGFSQAATLSSEEPITLGGIATTHTAGTAVVNADLQFTNGIRPVDVGDGSADIDLVVSGSLSNAAGPGNLIQKLGLGTLQLSGDQSAMAGGFRIGNADGTLAAGGRVIIDHPLALGPANAPLQIHSGIIEAASELTGANAIPRSVSVSAGDIGHAAFQGAPMRFTGSLLIDTYDFEPTTHRLRVNTDVRFDGSLNTSNFAFSLNIDGTGSLTIAGGTNDYSGSITLGGPDVTIDGTLSEISFLSMSTGTLRTGSSIGGTLIIGNGVGEDTVIDVANGIGTLMIDKVTFFSDVTLKLEIDPSGPIATSDKISATGDVALGGGIVTLQLELLGSEEIAEGTQFTIFERTTSGAITGYFDSLPDNTEFLLGGQLFRIDYGVGSGANDVIITAIPEPASACLISIALVGILGKTRRRWGMK